MLLTAFELVFYSFVEISWMHLARVQASQPNFDSEPGLKVNPIDSSLWWYRSQSESYLVSFRPTMPEF
jgi:hypothetical protein